MGNQTIEQMKLDFIADATERVERIIETLSSLSGLADSPGVDVDAIFRTAHSLKGTAGMFELGEISTLSGAIENLLEAIRSHKLHLDSKVAEVLIEGFDEILALLSKASGRRVATSPQRVIDEIEELLAGVQGKSEARDRIKPIVSDIDLSEEQEKLIRSRLSQGAEVLLARFDHLPTETAQEVLLRRIQDSGEILTMGYDERTNSLVVIVELRGEVAELEGAVRSAGGSLRRLDLDSNSDQTEQPADGRAKGWAQCPKDSSTKPTLSVKVDIKLLDEMMNSISELRSAQIGMTTIAQRIPSTSQTRRLRDDLLKLSLQVSKRISSLETTIAQVRLVPISMLFDRFRGEIRRLARRLGKRATLVVEGEETLIDRALLERIYEPMVHIVRNAIAHGIEKPEHRLANGKPEQGRILIRATQVANQLQIDIEDDGRGIDTDRIRQIARSKGLATPDDELLDLLFTPGFSTRDDVDDVAGRGVGLDAVKVQVEALRGTVSIKSVPRRGTTVSIHLPLTLTLSRGILVGEHSIPVVLPLNGITEVMRVAADEVKPHETLATIDYRGQKIKAYNMAEIFGMGDCECQYAVITCLGKSTWAALVSDIGGEVDIVSRPVPDVLCLPRFVSGATELADGRAALIIHPEYLKDALIQRDEQYRSGAWQWVGEVPNLTLNQGQLEVMVFRVGSGTFALPTGLVREVADMRAITHLPTLRPLWEGICFIRGICHGVASLGSPAPFEDGSSSRLIVLHVPKATAIAATEVTNVVTISAGDFKVEGKGCESKPLAEVARFTWEGEQVALLDVGSIVRKVLSET